MLLLTRWTCPQERLRLLSYRSTLDVPIATALAISGWLTTQRPYLRQPTPSTDRLHLGPVRPGTALAGPQPVLSATTCGAHRQKAFNGHVQVLIYHIGFRRGSCPWSPACPMTLPLLGLTHCRCCVGQPRWDCALPCTRATPGPAPASRPWPRTPTRTPTDTRWCNEPIAWAVTVPFQMHNNPVVRETVGIVILKACLWSIRRISRVCCTECRRGFEKM